MKLTVLGCSGGVSVGRRTTTLLVDEDILIDAGSGVGDLSLEQMRKIKRIYLTHSHLDHIAFLPLLVDSIFESISEPLVVYGQRATLDALKTHVFNWVIWPDFSALPTKDQPVMRFEVMRPGDVMTVDDRHIEMIAVNHIVPGVGYRVSCKTGAFAFSGDTTTNDTFWNVLNERSGLDILLVEAAFSNAELVLSRKSGHYNPALLAADIVKLKYRPSVYLSHAKPGQEDLILNECIDAIKDFEVAALKNGAEFSF